MVPIWHAAQQQRGGSVLPYKFPVRISLKSRLISLQPGTCCDRAAAIFSECAFALPPQRLFVESFAAAVEMAAGKPDDILLVPHVHEVCATLSTTEGWQLLDELVFPLDNPPLHLAKKFGSQPLFKGLPKHCATIEQLAPLLANHNPLSQPSFYFHFVQNTQTAARLCADSTNVEYCITNQHGLEQFELESVRQLKHMKIWWMPFRWTSEGDETQCKTT
jgi:hypothetical protein